MEKQEEKIFLKDNNVTITQSRFISLDTTYAMRNISSVSMFQIKKKKKKTLAILLIVIGVLFFIPSRGVLLLIGIAMIILNKDKYKYSVRIQSNAGEADGFISTDKVYIQKIIDSVNDAMIYRG